MDEQHILVKGQWTYLYMYYSTKAIIIGIGTALMIRNLAEDKL